MPQPRFNFKDKPDRKGEKPATFRTLINEMVYVEGQQHVDQRKFKRTRDFIRQLTGQPVSLTKPLPFSTLKTIKLLYLEKGLSENHLANLLDSRQLKKDPTFEFFNHFERDYRLYEELPLKKKASLKKKSKLREGPRPAILNLLQNLGGEITKSRRDLIDKLFMDPRRILDSLSEESDRILNTPTYISDPPPNDFGEWQKAVARPIDSFTKKIDAYDAKTLTSSGTSRRTPVPVHEQLYLHLLRLKFFHFVAELKEIIERANIEEKVNQNPIAEQMDALANEHVSWLFTDDRECKMPIMSVYQAPAFVELHADRLKGLVYAVLAKDLTNPTDHYGYIRPDTLDRIVDHACKIMAISFIQTQRAVNQELGIAALHRPLISVAHLVAALCTARYEQRVKHKYLSRVQGRGNEPMSIRNQLSKIAIEGLFKDDTLPHGAKQLLHREYGNFHSLILGTEEIERAKLAFRMSRIDQYVKCMESNDIERIEALIDQFNRFCKYSAQEYAGYYPLWDWRDPASVSTWSFDVEQHYRQYENTELPPSSPFKSYRN